MLKMLKKEQERDKKVAPFHWRPCAGASKRMGENTGQLQRARIERMKAGGLGTGPPPVSSTRSHLQKGK